MARKARTAAGALLALLVQLPGAVGAETVELRPQKRASWSAEHLFAPITGLFLGGPGYWYEPRRLEVETTPPGAYLDLFYVRGSFQQAFEQAEAPVTILLPSRIQATGRDSVTIRVLADGYSPREVNVRVRSRQERVSIDLEPLPNRLEALAHPYLAGRGSLTFLTREAPSIRLQKADDGLAVVLNQTASAPDVAHGLTDLRSALVASVRAQQLGSDLMVRVSLRENVREHLEIRSRQSREPVRGLHRFTLDLVPRDGDAEDVARALSALERIRATDVTGCSRIFDEALRGQLDAADLARALTPGGGFQDRYLRAAMRRLGEVSPRGVVALTDGATFDTSVPIELAAATSEAGTALGFLALLRRLVAELELPAHHRSTLRGLVAPELPPAAFYACLDRAEQRERECEEPRAAAGGRAGL